MRHRRALFAISLTIACGTPPAATPSATALPSPRKDARFDAIVLGASGGTDESDLTSVIVSRTGRSEWIALDAGTVYAGLVRAASQGSLPGVPRSKWNDAADVMKSHIHGIFVSHAHLDHVAGLILVSPESGATTVHGLSSTIDALRDHVFLSPLWANFSDEGDGALGRYHLDRMTPGASIEVAGANLRVEAQPLSHGWATDSTAFLVEADGAQLLYLGDTGPDAVEGAGRLASLWTRVVPLVRARTLRAIFVEASWPDPRPQELLFGHLTPQWIARELDALAARAQPEAPAHALEGLTLVVTHVKPNLERGRDARAEVRAQLAQLSERGVRVVVPRSGERLAL